MLVVAAVVPFLNEEWCLELFLDSMAAQTRTPDVLVLVDDGSTDGSPEIAHAFAASRDDVLVLRRPPRPAARDRLAEANELRAFQWGVEHLELDWDVVAKIDSDLELAPPRSRPWSAVSSKTHAWEWQGFV